MAALQVLLDAKFPAQTPSTVKGFRLTADASITVSEIARGISAFLWHVGTTCLWTCLCPPIDGPLNYGWQSLPHGPWLAKTGGLLFEMVCVAANTKLLQVKVQKALRVLYAEHEFSLPQGKKLDDMVDKCDTTLRILLSMIKQLKISEGAGSDLKEKTTRGLSDKDKFAIQCILDKVKLPLEAYKCIGVDSKDDSGDEGTLDDGHIEPMQLALRHEEHQPTQVREVPQGSVFKSIASALAQHTCFETSRTTSSTTSSTAFTRAIHRSPVQSMVSTLVPGSAKRASPCVDLFKYKTPKKASTVVRKLSFDSSTTQTPVAHPDEDLLQQANSFRSTNLKAPKVTKKVKKVDNKVDLKPAIAVAHI